MPLVLEGTPGGPERPPLRYHRKKGVVEKWNGVEWVESEMRAVVLLGPLGLKTDANEWRQAQVRAWIGKGAYEDWLMPTDALGEEGETYPDAVLTAIFPEPARGPDWVPMTPEEIKDEGLQAGNWRRNIRTGDVKRVAATPFEEEMKRGEDIPGYPAGTFWRTKPGGGYVEYKPAQAPHLTAQQQIGQALEAGDTARAQQLQDFLNQATPLELAQFQFDVEKWQAGQRQAAQAAQAAATAAQPKSVEQLLVQAWLAGDDEEVRRLQALRQQPSPLQEAQFGLQARQQAFTEAEAERAWALGQARSPGDWWAYMRLLGSQGPAQPYTGAPVVPRTWAEMYPGGEEARQAAVPGYTPPSPFTGPNVVPGAPAGIDPRVALAAAQATGAWQLPAAGAGPPTFTPQGTAGGVPPTPGVPSVLSGVATGGGWWVRDPEVGEKVYVPDVTDADYWEARGWETGYDEPPISAAPSPTAEKGISVEQFGEMPLPFTARDEALKSQGQSYQINAGTWNNPVPGTIFTPTAQFQTRAQAGAEARALAQAWKAGQVQVPGWGTYQPPQPRGWQGLYPGGAFRPQQVPGGLGQALRGEVVSPQRQWASLGASPSPASQSWARLLPGQQEMFLAEQEFLGIPRAGYGRQMVEQWPSWNKPVPFRRMPKVMGYG